MVTCNGVGVRRLNTNGLSALVKGRVTMALHFFTKLSIVNGNDPGSNRFTNDACGCDFVSTDGAGTDTAEDEVSNVCNCCRFDDDDTAATLCARP